MVTRGQGNEGKGETSTTLSLSLFSDHRKSRLCFQRHVVREDCFENSDQRNYCGIPISETYEGEVKNGKTKKMKSLSFFVELLFIATVSIHHATGFISHGTSFLLRHTNSRKLFRRQAAISPLSETLTQHSSEAIPTKFIFVGGKGGVGKTSVAAALAVACADADLRTLVCVCLFVYLKKSKTHKRAFFKNVLFSSSAETQCSVAIHTYRSCQQTQLTALEMHLPQSFLVLRLLF
jgi:hypothetical protein